MAQVVTLQKSVKERNQEVAEAIRARCAEAGVWSLNIMASPGAGKTTLIEKTVQGLHHEFRIGVIVGDLKTDQDARRIAATGLVQAEQVETNGACHMIAQSIQDFLPRFDLDKLDVLIIENVGNLVCPIGWDLGERNRVTLISVPEGDDKPTKYPNACVRTDALLITKMDALPIFDFSLERVRKDATTLNPDIQVLPLSARTGDGMEAWFDWIREKANAFREARGHPACKGSAACPS